jgi:hypothetical protein
MNKKFKIELSEPKLVYAPTMNEAISHWGVYAIPRMWREPDGSLIVRFNGEDDTEEPEDRQRLRSAYFRSVDNGATWERCNDDAHRFGGTGNGGWICGDLNVYGRVYMSTVGLGICYCDKTEK